MRTGIFNPHARPAQAAVERLARTLPAARPRL